MKTIKRIVGNILWLCNHPPTSINGKPALNAKCFHCGRTTDGLITLDNQKWAVCWRCIQKALESALEGK
jgi:uncharacterized paraquat-inducible protein A